MNFFIKVFGCQSNVYDGQKIEDLMLNAGYKKTFSDEANIIILNTCHIREKAEQKVLSEIGHYRKLKKTKDIQIVIIGCMAQAYGAKLHQYGVDIILGPQSYHLLPYKLKTKTVIRDFTPEEKFDSLPKVKSINSVSCYIAIQEGCNKFCTYCVVPYTRGPEFCRKPEQIYEEAQRLISLGAKEIILLGQNVNAYEYNECKLSHLIKNISDMGIERISYTSSHPSNVSDDLIEAHNIQALLPHLHFAVQSGSNKILKLMNRSHDVEKYLDIVNSIKQIRKDMTFSTDIIVGFPGETEEDFEMTLDLIHKVQFIQVYYFAYSPRKGTIAANMKNQISLEVKFERMNRLKEILHKYQYEHNNALVNHEIAVLIENKKPNNEYFGRDIHMRPVHVHSNNDLKTGEIYNVKVQKAFLKSLEGHIV